MDLIFFEVFVNELQRVQLNRSRRILRDSSDPFNIPDVLFKGLYRISKDMGHWLLLEIAPHMRDSERNSHIPKDIRVFTALQFLAQGSYQKGVGQDFLCSMSQSSVSRCLAEVADIIVEYLGYLVHFPTTVEEKRQEKQRFMNVPNGFPGIIGCIDGTQIKIHAPNRNDPDQPGLIYYCRKGFYSLNVQIICNAEAKILNINARFPGSSHNAAIWQTSQVRTHLINSNLNNTYLLGDSGYALEKWLLTPVLRPKTDQEESYNVAHRSVRNIVERCNGYLKQRFRCLNKQRTLYYKPERAAQIIIYSCAILHNICVERNEDIPADYVEENGNDHDEQAGIIADNTNGHTVRNAVIQNNF